MRGVNYQTELSVTRMRESAQILAALRMYYVRILMSYLSISMNSFRSSHIIVGDFDVRCVSIHMTVRLSSCSRRRCPLSSGRKCWIVHRTSFGSLKVMCCGKSGAGLDVVVEDSTPSVTALVAV
jgi:hypothetical protein